MILWFRHFPKISMDTAEWKPFIKNDWFRVHYMKFVYLLQATLILFAFFIDFGYRSINQFTLILIGVIVFIIHEVLHVIVIYNKGDISLTFSGFFWLNTNAVLSKMRFWTFMSLPLIGLSVVPAILSLFVSGEIQSILIYISLLNLIISGSDIFNSFLIAIKPKNSVFCRGYYRVE
ncbi:putative zincin peptidase [Ureibacillus acetophenoni]|uniref:Putative zincin peptidase n=2 Tax=Ureibacillus acetophenoni TaxID=614649 RepID=A0A285UQA0_9BACL|nr:putative zincin peptidase [Ureibacillus acetophenoni]